MNGPAFPSPGVVLQSGQQQGAYEGMSLRDYFAAHAPAPAKWFEPEVPPMPKPIWSDELSRINGAEPTNNAQINAWRVECYRQLSIQWPWAWADAVLSARDS